MVTLTLVLLSSAVAADISHVDRADLEAMALRVRAYAEDGVDPATLRRAREVAEHLLTTAGLRTTWRVCGADHHCTAGDRSAPEVIVILSPRDRPLGEDVCGAVALDPLDNGGTVIVSVPCVAAVAARLARRIDGRADPRLAAGQYDDLVGAVVAHEIGHVLGLGHAPTGLMRASLGLADVVALRHGRLGFTDRESAHMRAWGGRR